MYPHDQHDPAALRKNQVTAPTNAARMAVLEASGPSSQRQEAAAAASCWKLRSPGAAVIRMAATCRCIGEGRSAMGSIL